MLTSATEHYERQQRFTAAALVAARRRPWRDVRSIAILIATFQTLAAQDALDSIDPMLEEQDLYVEPVAVAAAQSFAGTASDGRPLVSLLEQATSPESLGLMVVTQVQDAARTAAGVGIATRPRTGYVRMLNPPSCSRCVILAGRFYRWSSGFDRHPGCDCRHVPSVENVSGDLRTDPQAYFDSLDPAGKLKFAGSKANLQAIEDGADITQIVNAYRRNGGMQVAGTSAIERRYGMKWTASGSTDRSLTYQQQVGLGVRQAKRTAGTNVRLMPESIYANAGSREEALQMLRANGWISDVDARATGRSALDATRRVERNERRRARRAAARDQAAAAARAPDLDELREAARRSRERRRSR